MESRFPLTRGPVDKSMGNHLSVKFVWTWEHAKAVAWWAMDKFLWMQAVNPWDGLDFLLYVLKSLAEFEEVLRSCVGISYFHQGVGWSFSGPRDGIKVSGSGVASFQNDATHPPQGVGPTAPVVAPEIRGIVIAIPPDVAGTDVLIATLATFPAEAFPNPVSGFILSWTAVMGVSPNPLVSASLFNSFWFYEFRCS